MKKNKYQYLKVLQGMFDGKWSDLIACNERCTMEELIEFRTNMKLYKENDPRPYRIIHRRMLASEQFHA